jgi:hypothetical protein
MDGNSSRKYLSIVQKLDLHIPGFLVYRIEKRKFAGSLLWRNPEELPKY